MKQLIAVSAALFVAGCATTQSTSQVPYYDEGQQALIGEGYPAPRIEPPSSFSLVKKYDDARAQPGSNTINSREIGATWVDGDDLTAVATALYQGLDEGFQWGAGDNIEGVDQVGGTRFEYATGDGFYQDVTGDIDFIPDGAPKCAHSVALISYSDDRSKRTLLTYTEGLAYCGNRLVINDEVDDELRERAYQAFGLAR
ncbi:hypothetical protein AAG587_08500 [Vreelandella neptunia]|uniref:hypothetical protein n=1 Tax=Vreelandella neptunia TaxID=115551 RepID=UPI00315B34A9